MVHTLGSGPMPREKEPQAGLTNAIRRRRAELGITQKELAERCGIDQSEASELESGEANPSWGRVKRVAAALEMPFLELVVAADELEQRLNPDDKFRLKPGKGRKVVLDSYRVEDVD